MLQKLFIFLILVNYCKAQNTKFDTIDYSNKQIIFQNREIAFPELKSILKSNPESLPLFRQSKVLNFSSQMFAGLGGFGIGYPIGMAIGGNRKPIWAMAAVGAGLIGIAIPFSIAANKKLKKSILAFNEFQKGKPTSKNTYLNLNLIVKTNEFGLKIDF